MEEASFDELIAINLKGPWLMTRAAFRVMIPAKRGGAIVNTSSFLSTAATIGTSAYSASKAGLDAGIELALGVLPQAPVLLQPGKTAFDHPTLGHELERVQFATPGDLHRHVLAQDRLDTLGEWAAHMATVGQHALNLGQMRPAPRHRLQGALGR